MRDDEVYLQRAVQLAAHNVAAGGRPFGAVLVKDGHVIAEAANAIHLSQDPTAHAELLAIRAASQQYAASNEQAQPFGLSTAGVYAQMALPLSAQALPVEHLEQPAMIGLYRDWQARHAAG